MKRPEVEIPELVFDEDGQIGLGGGEPTLCVAGAIGGKVGDVVGRVGIPAALVAAGAEEGE